MIRTFSSFVAMILTLLGGLCVAAMMCVSLADALLRQFNRPILGASEMSEALMVVAICCALPLSVLSGKAVAIDILVKRLPGLVRTGVVWLAATASAAILAFFGYRSFIAGLEAEDFGEASLLLSIPFGPFYMAISAAAALTALAILYETGVGRARIAARPVPENAPKTSADGGPDGS